MPQGSAYRLPRWKWQKARASSSEASPTGALQARSERLLYSVQSTVFDTGLLGYLNLSHSHPCCLPVLLLPTT